MPRVDDGIGPGGADTTVRADPERIKAAVSALTVDAVRRMKDVHLSVGADPRNRDLESASWQQSPIAAFEPG